MCVCGIFFLKKKKSFKNLKLLRIIFKKVLRIIFKKVLRFIFKKVLRIYKLFSKKMILINKRSRFTKIEIS
jgi:hypothetical protein